MIHETARHILQALLAETGMSVPAAGGDAEAGAKLLLQALLDAETPGALPAETATAIASTLDAIAAADNR